MEALNGIFRYHHEIGTEFTYRDKFFLNAFKPGVPEVLAYRDCSLTWAVIRETMMYLDTLMKSCANELIGGDGNGNITTRDVLHQALMNHVKSWELEVREMNQESSDDHCAELMIFLSTWRPEWVHNK